MKKTSILLLFTFCSSLLTTSCLPEKETYILTIYQHEVVSLKKDDGFAILDPNVLSQTLIRIEEEEYINEKYLSQIYKSLSYVIPTNLVGKEFNFTYIYTEYNYETNYAYSPLTTGMIDKDMTLHFGLVEKNMVF